MPKISVIMPVYNTEKYISETIESILNQTFKDFEFVIIDDYSNDGTFQILQSYANQDSRIKLIQNPENIGVVKTRNKLFSKVSPESKYIAIIDSDDIAEPDRLQKQFDFLEENNEYSIVGSNITIIDENGQKIGQRKYPSNHEQVSKTILKKSPLAQPVVMIRKKDLEKVGYYNEEFERCQDYELWFRFFDAGYKIANIQENLLNYRVFEGQGKSKHLKLTLKNTIKVQSKYLFKIKYFDISSFFYHIALRVLMLLPNSFVLWLFKNLEYKS
ncbi:glycosyltransferase family 2 protein [Candidatus Absconditicoccus praedator]|uniref:glycosyltransferase family 2 protein n=1 Tax=Candidatus Absconditicoccus praedator TaxID=2735562 RepID=UPI001E392F8D|nr:glycosyltransferase [Candidatus Absconditicoccus praedator]UFX82761.1 glycosyltransferase [Candidatus Absconditicoccus praedator]